MAQAQSSTVRPHWVRTTHPSPIDVQAICVEAEQDAWMLLDIIEMEREVREREPIDDRPEDWAAFELEIDFCSHNLYGLLPE